MALTYATPFSTNFVKKALFFRIDLFSHAILNKISKIVMIINVPIIAYFQSFAINIVT